MDVFFNSVLNPLFIDRLSQIRKIPQEIYREKQKNKYLWQVENFSTIFTQFGVI
jgi:hypothetical protein